MKGYNWRNTLTEHSAISGVLAGFSITAIALILSTSTGEIPIFFLVITYGQVAILFFGISTGIFITSAELFLRAKSFDQYDIPKPYYDKIDEKSKEKGENWNEDYTSQCRKDQGQARKFYNIGLFAMFFGMFFLIAPYNYIISLIITGFGIILQIWQIVRTKS